MTPSEVLDAKVDLMDRLRDTKFRALADNLGDFEFGRSGGYRAQNSTNLASMLEKALSRADVFRVTHDMSLMVQHVASQLDDTDQWHSDLAPAECGFVVFDRPLPLVDMRGKTMLMHYLIWGPVQTIFHAAVRSRFDTATLTVAYNDMWREPDEVELAQREQFTEEQYADYRRIAGRWATVGASAYFDSQRLGPAMAMPDEEAQARILAEGDTPHPGTNGMRYVHALWLLMGQTVAHVASETPDRPSRRRAIKKKIPAKVTVVRLRREADSQQREGESMVEWAHRFIVKGHLRWQPYGSRKVDHVHHLGPMEVDGHGKPMRRCIHEDCDHHVERIWIAPYMKNAHRADLPLIQTEKVYSLER